MREGAEILLQLLRYINREKCMMRPITLLEIVDCLGITDDERQQIVAQMQNEIALFEQIEKELL